MENISRTSLLWMRISKKFFFLLHLLIFHQLSTISSKKVVLLDTSNSTTELRWKTHSNVDDDEIGWLEETYRGSEGLENRRAYVVCNVEHPNVDNWLRTPRIERNGANRLHVEVTFTMRDCSEFPGNARSCKETFRLYGVQVTNGQELKETWNSSYWDLIDAITTDLGRHSDHDSSSAAVNKEVRSYTVTKDAAYFAFRDSGACISILNVRVYYEVCPEVLRSFVHFPRTITGSEAHSIIAVKGKCVKNAKPSGVTKDSTYVCKATGSWDVLTGECKCNPGYVESVKYNTCMACAVGTYKANPGEGECVICPTNSRSLNTGSAGCQCDEGYYRAEEDSIHDACAQPPSKPSSLSATKIHQTSVVIEWDEPLVLGNRKELWYRYKCAACSSNVQAIPSTDTFTERKLQLSHLQAGTTYTVMIFAENEISKVVADINYALVEFTTKTLSPINVSDLRIEGVQDGGVTIAWKSPNASTKRQQQLMYEIEMKYNDSVTITETVHTYHTFNNLNPQFPHSFKVRVLTSDGWGSWSNMLWYQANSLNVPTSHTRTTIDQNYSADESSGIMDEEISFFEPPPWFWILLLCLILSIILSVLLFCSRRGRNRKHFSDCDGLDSYKNGTLTPDYNTPPPQDLMQNLIRAKLGAPLISTNSSQSACYGNTRFKPYVDPTAYEDPNQALSEFANDVDPSMIRITEVIGSGEFGEVCKGVLQFHPRMNGCDILQMQTVAIKTLKPGSSEKAKSDFLMEASIMGQFEHENVVKLIGVVTKSEPIMIVTEYMENGSLDQFLRQNDDGFIGIGQIICMLKGIAAGMKYLTEKGYVHRDLAARNVLVDIELQCKIADFGLSRGLEGSIEQEYTTNGGKIPVRWTAPEAITHRKFTAASDVWSFGVVMWEVCSFGERPYWEWTNQKVISEVALGYRLPPPMDTPTALHNLMLRCWHIDRYKRPTFAQILQILEEYSRHPDLIFVGDVNMANIHASLSPFQSVLQSTGNLIKNKDPNTPTPPTTLPPPVPLEEFLARIGLSHCLPKLNVAGFQTVSTLMRVGHIDLLSYGLTSDEAQRISDALSRPLATMHRTTDKSEARLFHTPQPPPRMINASGSLAASSHPKDGFFV